MVKKKNSEKASSNDDPKVFAFLAAFFSIVGFIIALVTKKEDKYVMFYAKQSLVIFILYLISGIVAMIPFIGWFILGPIMYLITTVLWVISWIYALSGEQKDVPIIGEYAKKLNL